MKKTKQTKQKNKPPKTKSILKNHSTKGRKERWVNNELRPTLIKLAKTVSNTIQYKHTCNTTDGDIFSLMGYTSFELNLKPL